MPEDDAEVLESAIRRAIDAVAKRYELYKQITDVFRQSRRSVPVFFDKHLSYDWDRAKWMYDQHREMGFPLMAGSGQPYTWRRPPLEFDLNTPVEKAVMCYYGSKEAYGFHGIEMLQCMVERRKGVETGIRAVQCLEGPEVWRWRDQTPWAAHLLNSALARCESRKPGSMKDAVEKPILFLLDYRDSLQAAVFILEGYIRDAGFSAAIRGNSTPVSTEFWAQPGRPWSHCSGHVYYNGTTISNGHSPLPC